MDVEVKLLTNIQVEDEIYHVSRMRPDLFDTIRRSLEKNYQVTLTYDDEHEDYSLSVDEHKDKYDENKCYVLYPRSEPGIYLESHINNMTNKRINSRSIEELRDVRDQFQKRFIDECNYKWFAQINIIDYYALKIACQAKTNNEFEALRYAYGYCEETQLDIEFIKIYRNILNTYYTKYNDFLNRCETLIKLRSVSILDYDNRELSTYISNINGYWFINPTYDIEKCDDKRFGIKTANLKYYHTYQEFPLLSFNGYPLIVNSPPFTTESEAINWLGVQIKQYVHPLRSNWNLKEIVKEFKLRPGSNLRKFSNVSKTTFHIKQFDYSK